MRSQLQSRFHPFTDMQKWLVFAALIPLCPAISMLVLYLGYDRGGSSDLITGYVMMFFALPYSFFHTLTFTPWFDGESHPGLMALFWLPFVVGHLTFFYTRSGWALWFITIMWLVAAPRWHYYALATLRI